MQFTYTYDYTSRIQVHYTTIIHVSATYIDKVLLFRALMMVATGRYGHFQNIERIKHNGTTQQ